MKTKKMLNTYGGNEIRRKTRYVTICLEIAPSSELPRSSKKTSSRQAVPRLVNLQNRYVLQVGKELSASVFFFSFSFFSVSFFFLPSVLYRYSKAARDAASTLTVVLLIIYLKPCATTCVGPVALSMNFNDRCNA